MPILPLSTIKCQLPTTSCSEVSLGPNKKGRKKKNCLPPQGPSAFNRNKHQHQGWLKLSWDSLVHFYSIAMSQRINFMFSPLYLPQRGFSKIIFNPFKRIIRVFWGIRAVFGSFEKRKGMYDKSGLKCSKCPFILLMFF